MEAEKKIGVTFKKTQAWEPRRSMMGGSLPYDIAQWPPQNLSRIAKNGDNRMEGDRWKSSVVVTNVSVKNVVGFRTKILRKSQNKKGRRKKKLRSILTLSQLSFINERKIGERFVVFFSSSILKTPSWYAPP